MRQFSLAIDDLFIQLGGTMNVKSDKERKSGVVIFRVTRDDRKQLERLSKSTGLSFSGIFRLKVLGVVTPLPFSDEEKKAIADSAAISNRTDLSDRKKKKLHSDALLKRIVEKHSEHEKVKRYRRNRSA